jgi:hypothetical protein
MPSTFRSKRNRLSGELRDVVFSARLYLQIEGDVTRENSPRSMPSAALCHSSSTLITPQPRNGDSLNLASTGTYVPFYLYPVA